MKPVTPKLGWFKNWVDSEPCRNLDLLAISLAEAEGSLLSWRRLTTSGRRNSSSHADFSESSTPSSFQESGNSRPRGTTHEGRSCGPVRLMRPPQCWRDILRWRSSRIPNRDQESPQTDVAEALPRNVITCTCVRVCVCVYVRTCVCVCTYVH